MTLGLIGIVTLILVSSLLLIYAIKPVRRFLFPNPTFQGFFVSLVATFAGVFLAATVTQQDRMADSKVRTLRLLASTLCQVESEAIAAHITFERIRKPQLNPQDASPIWENLVQSQATARLAEAVLRSELVRQHLEPDLAFRTSANVSGAILSAERAITDEAAPEFVEHVRRLRDHLINASDLLAIQVGLLRERVTDECVDKLFDALNRFFVMGGPNADEAIEQAAQVDPKCAAFAEDTVFLQFLQDGRRSSRCD